MKNMTKTTITAAALLTASFSGAAEDKAVAATLGSTAGAVGSGVVDAGRGLVSLPGRAMGSGDTGLPMLYAGTQELGISGNVNFTDDVVYNLDLSYGYFFRDCWQVGFTANAFGDDDFNFGVGLFTEYNFSTGSKWVPYVGVSAKWARVDSEFFDDDSIAFGGELGVKYFIRSHMAVFAAVNFEWSPDDIFGVGDEIKDNAQNINIGMRFYF